MTSCAPTVNLKLVDIDAGETLAAYVEATSGNLIPTLLLRDYGGKAIEQPTWAARNLRRRYSTR